MPTNVLGLGSAAASDDEGLPLNPDSLFKRNAGAAVSATSVIALLRELLNDDSGLLPAHDSCLLPRWEKIRKGDDDEGTTFTNDELETLFTISSEKSWGTWPGPLTATPAVWYTATEAMILQLPDLTICMIIPLSLLQNYLTTALTTSASESWPHPNKCRNLRSPWIFRSKSFNPSSEFCNVSEIQHTGKLICRVIRKKPCPTYPNPQSPRLKSSQPLWQICYRQ
jgi:hypothetical protein